MNLTGSMPSVGASRFGLFSRQAGVSARVPIRPAQVSDRQVVMGQVPDELYLSATKKPLVVGQVVRGSDKTQNRKVDRNFRGTILEFIPPTAEGNNVRVRCNNSGKVYRVNAAEIRAVL